MLLSMTGFGEARRRTDSLEVAVEIRSINSRYFKMSIRCSERYGSLEPKIEKLLRKGIQRGTLLVSVTVLRQPSPDDFQINEVVLESYCRQASQLADRIGVEAAMSVDTFLTLPGVVNDRAGQTPHVDAEWPVIKETLLEAIENLNEMRRDEGRAMHADMKANCRAVLEQTERVERRAPEVVEAYRQRLMTRLERMLAQLDVAADPAAVIREAAMFAERTDVAEETVRLRSHLEQFQTFLDAETSAGRKMDFLVQEMFREANTIGAKGNDPEISQCVVNIKSAIERMREMIQNVE